MVPRLACITNTGETLPWIALIKAILVTVWPAVTASICALDRATGSEAKLMADMDNRGTASSDFFILILQTKIKLFKKKALSFT